jgi:glycosyltransferase involved in cell wall biosynthesis
MGYTILTYNNGVGILNDAILLQNLIKNNITSDVKINYLTHPIPKNDVGIWIQNFDGNYLNNFKTNVFFINEEWAGVTELNSLKYFDVVVCKSQYAKTLLKPYADVTYLPFISYDYYNKDIVPVNKMLNFTGRSIQKNTELLLKLNHPVTLIDPYNRYGIPSNVTHINTYQTNEQIKYILNSHQIHICISLYESWGHYMFEGLSTGTEIICSDIPVFKEQLDPNLVHFIPVTENINLEYMFDRDNIKNIFPLRKSYYVDEEIYNNTINNFVPIGKSNERRKLFNNIISKNSQQLIQFLSQLR